MSEQTHGIEDKEAILSRLYHRECRKITNGHRTLWLGCSVYPEPEIKTIYDPISERYYDDPSYTAELKKLKEECMSSQGRGYLMDEYELDLLREAKREEYERKSQEGLRGFINNLKRKAKK